MHLRNMLLASLFAALTAAVAKLAIPGVAAVPITLQVLIVFLAGAMLGPVWGGIAMLVYVLMGAVGMPVFAGGRGGLQVLLGATGGYLFSYPIAAFVIGILAPAHRRPPLWRTAGAMLAGLVVIYAGGGSWAVLVGGNAMGAVMSGWVLPFVPVDLLKLAVAAPLAAAVNRALAAQGYWASSRV